jgi:TolA-binding protein
MPLLVNTTQSKMNKYIITLVLTTLSGFSFSQVSNETLSQAEKNKLKAEELKSKLEALESDTSHEFSQTVMPRIVSLEERVDVLEAQISELKKVNQQLTEKTQSTQSTQNTVEPSKNNSLNTSNFSNSYYLVIESQNKISNAKVAYDKYTAQLKIPLKLVRNSTTNWYYLVLENPMTYTSAKELQAQYRTRSFKDAWVIAGDKVSPF